MGLVTTGIREFNGHPFDLRGSVQLADNSVSKDEAYLPKKVEGIRLPGRCRRLHFLHATLGAVADGTKVGAYILHSASDDTRDLPLVYGHHLRYWLLTPGSDREVTDGKCVTLGTNPLGEEVRLYHTAWENPWPDTDLRSLDFVPATTEPAPFLVAITVE
jgi:hypothetical protein